jgi:hypothetical protein
MDVGGGCCALVGGGTVSFNAFTKSSTGRSHGDRSWLGRLTAAPNTNSADETALSSFGAARKPSNTHGKCCGHSAPASLALSASFSWRCARSIMPFDWGWKAVVVMCCMCRVEQSTFQIAEQNWVPLSDVITAGTPNLEIHVSTRASAHVRASMFLSGVASSHLVLRSIIVRM